MARQSITESTDGPAVGPFSPATTSSAGGPIYVSGQVGIDPHTGAIVDGGVAAQTAQAMRNLAAILTATGKGFPDVLRVGVYLTDMAAYGDMNGAYQEYFDAPFPARTAIQVAGLPLGAAVEIDAVVG